MQKWQIITENCFWFWQITADPHTRKKVDIAIKFEYKHANSYAENEAASYKRLGAYVKSSGASVDCELYGIPKIYYIGEYKNFNVLGMTKLTCTLEKIMQQKKQNENDVLCAFRDVVSLLNSFTS